MSIQTHAPEFVELSASEASETQGGLVFAAGVVLVWMGKAFIAGVTLGAAAAAAYYSSQD
jgi:hypothetical protein